MSTAAQTFATAVNETALGADGYGLLAPLGDRENEFTLADPAAFKAAFPAAQVIETGGVSKVLGIQRITAENSKALADGFNSLSGRVRRWFRGAPIYMRHPDAAGSTATDAAHRGLVTRLEARPDGLHGLPVFNDLGADAVNGDEKLFFSVRLGVQPTGVDAATGRVVFEPASFISLGLTPNPNLAADAANSSPTSPITSPSMNITALTAALAAAGATPADSSESSILSAIGQLGQRAGAGATAANERTTLKADNDRLAKELADLKAIAENEAKTRRDGLIAAAITDGRLTEAEKARWDALLKADAVNSEPVLAGLPKKVKTAPVAGAAAAAQAGAASAENESPEGFAATHARLKAADPKAGATAHITAAVAANPRGHAAWIAAKQQPALG